MIRSVGGRHGRWDKALYNSCVNPARRRDPPAAQGNCNTHKAAKEICLATEKIVIIGSGPAGWAAAIYAPRAELAPWSSKGPSPKPTAWRGRCPWVS